VLALRPKLLLLDEPFAAVDAITREQMHELLIDLHRATDLTMLLVTHDAAEPWPWPTGWFILGAPGRGIVASFAPLPRPGRATPADPEHAAARKRTTAVLRAELATEHLQ
jgi:NitT/TauT family transport system ATP-binding protein